ncbi:MAG TPA: SRPBCC family protein [Blastocatellia bacterium]|nr:SRPBCC family protein [Blastocatellia bacterium]
MNKTATLIGGIGLGAGLMYILDPDRGNRRRAMVRDKTIRAWHKSGDAIGKTSRDITNRTRGVIAEITHLFKREEVDDDVLVERVRSKMGRVVSHPHSVEVTANNGRVTLSGLILEHELNSLLKCVSSVRGVGEIDNQLEVHKTAGDIPGLQGGGYRPGDRFELMQENWSPTARVLTGIAGGALAAYGAMRMDVPGLVLSAVGLGLLTRGATNVEMKRLVGLGGGRRAVDIHKNININAPVEQVYQFWTNYENFPRFMTNVLEVTDSGGGRSHWKVAGPAGIPVEWDAVVTKQVPNEVFAWKTVPGSAIEHAGIIRFQSNADGGTTIDIRMSYNPVAGAVGHAVASLFGADPKTQMDEDLMRMKTLIETGNAPRDAAERHATARQWL